MIFTFSWNFLGKPFMKKAIKGTKNANVLRTNPIKANGKLQINSLYKSF